MKKKTYSSRSGWPKPKTIDEYVAQLSPDKRVALQSLRETISRTIPELEECISYGVPAFRFNGKFLLALASKDPLLRDKIEETLVISPRSNPLHSQREA